MIHDTILIGPYGVGKSENARLLSGSLGIPNKALDDFAYRYYEGMDGFTNEEAARRDLDDPWWQPYSAYAVKRFLADLEDASYVMDFGAHHSVFDSDLLNQMLQVLAPYNVILLLPSPDPEESIHVLTERHAGHFYKARQPHARMNRYIIEHPSNYKLAKHTICTSDKSPQQTCGEILALLRH